MSQASLTFEHLKAQVCAVRQKVEGANRIGIHTMAGWQDMDETSDPSLTYKIRYCVSSLALREALRSPVAEGEVLLLLTPLEEVDEDILMRLAKGRLFHIDRWQIIRSLFSAKAVDPRLTKKNWLAEELLQLPGGKIKAASPGGFLDEETVWGVILTLRLGMPSGRMDLKSLLEWSLTEENVRRSLGLRDPLKQGLVQWLEQSAGPAARVVVNLILRTQSTDAVALGHVLGVIAEQGDRELKLAAMARAEERYLSGESLDAPILKAWSMAATGLLSRLNGDAARRCQVRMDELFAELRAVDAAKDSDFSSIGFTARLQNLGQIILNLLEQQSFSSDAMDQLRAALVSIRRHANHAKNSNRVRRCDMAVRLMHWLGQTKGKVSDSDSFAAAALYELQEGAFLDWARLTLRYAESVESLSQAYTKILRLVSGVREEQAEKFACKLVGWLETGSSREEVLRIERVLDRLVAPAALRAPVLLIVLDGMSNAVFRELMEDFGRKDWSMLLLDPPLEKPVIAGIPSVTDMSRCSLLTGRVVSGGQEVERTGFAEHPGLLSACRSKSPPILFHKASLQQDSGLSPELRKEIESSHRRVVGVVLNAVDDQLSGGDQLDFQWETGSIHVLDALLEVARVQNRLVVLLTDHGHVLENDSVEIPVSEGEKGVRWRKSGGPAGQGEIELKSSAPGRGTEGSVILPWSERIRYGAKRNGYHGGANPQEIVLSTAVLRASDRGTEEEEADFSARYPLWWDLTGREDYAERPIVSVFAPTRRQPECPDLFSSDWQEPQATPSARRQEPGWIDALLSSPVYAQQKTHCGRVVPNEDQVRQFLHFLDERGGSTTLGGLVRALNCPKLRLRGLLSMLQRLLNFDGYPILVNDEAADKVELNMPLLKKQFGIDSK